MLVSFETANQTTICLSHISHAQELYAFIDEPARNEQCNFGLLIWFPIYRSGNEYYEHKAAN